MTGSLLDSLCPLLLLFKQLFVANVGLLVILLIVMPFVDRGSSSFYVGLMAIGVMSISLVGSGVVIRLCGKRERHR